MPGISNIQIYKVLNIETVSSNFWWFEWIFIMNVRGRRKVIFKGIIFNAAVFDIWVNVFFVYTDVVIQVENGVI